MPFFRVLHPDLKTLPDQPQVQLIGNGKVTDTAIAPGLDPLPTLKHPHHKTFHKTVISDADDQAGFTRFYRWLAFILSYVDFWSSEPDQLSIMFSVGIRSIEHLQAHRRCLVQSGPTPSNDSTSTTSSWW